MQAVDFHRFAESKKKFVVTANVLVTDVHNVYKVRKKYSEVEDIF